MRHLLPFFAVLALGACEPTATSTPASATATTADGDGKLIRKGEVEYRVDDLAAARTFLRQLTADHGGEVHGDRQDTVAGASRLRLRVRVPAERFEVFAAAIGTIGVLVHSELDVTDVTAPWLDLEARLTAKTALEQRYLELVGRAANIAEVLSVEAELGKVRGDLESMQAQMRGLRDQVAMSSLAITCLQPRAIAMDADFAASLRTGWNGLVRTTAGLLTVWPVIAIASLGLAYLRWRMVRAARVPVTTG